MHVFMTSKAVELGRQVRTQVGHVRGHRRDVSGVLAFRGIPYAAPPVGPLRWRAPQPPTPWIGVRDALTFGARCLSALEDDHRPGRAVRIASISMFGPPRSGLTRSGP